MAAGGKKAHDFAASAASSSLTITPLAAGDSVVRLDSDQSDQTNRNVLMLYVNAAEAALLSTTGGAGTARAITYTAPSHNFSGPIVGNGTITTTGGFGLVPGAKPALRFESSGWRLEFDVGYLTYRTWDNASPFSCDPNGNFSIGGMGYKPGGGPWTDSSDGRIKDNIADYTSGLDAVLALRPVSYTFKAETGRDTAIKYVGLIGQEAERAMPEIVTTKADKVGDLEFSDMRTLDSGPLVYALVNAVKELAERVGKLEGA
jgi:hypothetical protein